MRKPSIYQFIEENYILDFRVPGRSNGHNFADVPINVYRPKIINPLPDKMKEYVVDTAQSGYSNGGGRRWFPHNPDYGIFDAFCVFKYYRNRTDVYVCSILRRPFREEQRDFYSNNCAIITAPSRIYAPWDSAVDSPELRAAVQKFIKENPRKIY